MALPRLVDHVYMEKGWVPEVEAHPCFLYDFKRIGITPEQFGEIISGKEAMIFEKPIVEGLRAFKCPWCEFNERKIPFIGKKRRKKNLNHQLEYHVQKHNKNFVSVQSLKFQKELYTLRLQIVKQGWHEAMPFLLEHDCHFCRSPVVPGREGMCALPESSRNKMRNLKRLGYPIGHIKKIRKVEWSLLGVIVLIKN